MRAVVTKTGELRGIEVLKGDPLLVPAALDAVRQWRYSPCLLNAEPVEWVASFQIDFNLSQ
jgi:protein TonB